MGRERLSIILMVGSLPLLASWELVTEFELKKSRGKVGFPNFELEATDGDSFRFYQHEWAQHGRFNLALMNLETAKGIGFADRAISDTFRLKYKIALSDSELLEFSNFLVAHYSDYPVWSETNYFRDYTKINEAGYPLWVRTMKKPERSYEAYLEFKKTKP
jgi:hypothetical protein